MIVDCLKTVKVRKQLEKENREIKTEFEIKNMELRQLQDKAASYENENERFQRSLLEAHQKLADERVKSEAKEKGSFLKYIGVPYLIKICGSPVFRSRKVFQRFHYHALEILRKWTSLKVDQNCNFACNHKF